MKRWMRFLMAFCAVALLQVSAASAVSVISAKLKNPPAGGSFLVGDVVEILIGLSVENGRKSFGGGVELGFDETQLELLSFQLDAFWPFNPAKPEDSFNRPLGFFDNKKLLAVGDFNPFDGERAIGVAMFRALKTGDGSVMVGGENVFPAGPFIGDDGGELPVEFMGASYSIENVIPEPGTLLLLSTGLAGLAASRRSRA